jgi:large subunit ribosomal protein L21
MYAVIEQGGRQYKVSEGDVIKIDLTEVKPNAKKIEIDKVLLVSDGKDVQVGAPYLDGAKVVAKFEATADEAVVKGPKLYPTHLRRRKNSSTKRGHRQKYLEVTVDSIKA